MTLQLPNGYGIVTYHWSYNVLGRLMSVTVGVRDVASSNDAQAIANAYQANITGTAKPAAANQMTTSWSQTQTSVLLRTSTGFLVTAQNNTITTGTLTASGADVPIYTPLVVSKLTALAGRAFRGRMYPPFVAQTEANVDAGGAITPAVVTSIGALWNAWLATANASSFTPFLLHTDVGVGTPSPNAIAQLVVRPVTGIQRRRRTRGA